MRRKAHVSLPAPLCTRPGNRRQGASRKRLRSMLHMVALVLPASDSFVLLLAVLGPVHNDTHIEAIPACCSHVMARQHRPASTEQKLS